MKNIQKPVRVYRVLVEPETAGKVIGEDRPKSKQSRWVTVAAAIVILVAGVLAIWNFYLRHPSFMPASVEKMAFPLPEKPSIAVLPFENLSGDPGQKYFVDGMTEDMITDLSKLSSLFAAARNVGFSIQGEGCGREEDKPGAWGPLSSGREC